MVLSKIQIILIVILIPLGILFLYAENRGVSIVEVFQSEIDIMKIGDVPIQVEVASSHEDRLTGLSGRDGIDGVSGLLFIFPEAGYHSIWMKDMKFPIDIIWIDENLLVAGIEKNVTPDTYPNLFRPPRPVKYVLETDIHYADTFDIHEGQKVTLPDDYLE